MISLCNNWEFTETWSDAFAMGEGTGEAVRLPHTVRQLPLHYADKLADYYGVSVDYLLGRTNIKKPYPKK